MASMRMLVPEVEALEADEMKDCWVWAVASKVVVCALPYHSLLQSLHQASQACVKD